MSELILAAFQALGPGPDHRQLELVAKALRESDDCEALALFDEPIRGHGDEDRLAELAEQAGSSTFVALDLYVEVLNPGVLVRGSDV